MNDRLRKQTALTSFMLVVLASPMLSLAGKVYDNGRIGWNAQICCDEDRSKIQVYVNTTALKRDSVIREATFLIAFYGERNRLIENKTYYLRDQAVVALIPGEYRLVFDNPHRNAISVKAINLHIPPKGMGTVGGAPDRDSYETVVVPFPSLPVVFGRPPSDRDTSPSTIAPGVFVNRIPDDLRQKLQEVVHAGNRIESVSFSKDGGWLILDERSYSWSAIPQATLDELTRLVNAGSHIDRVAFAQNGAWLIVFDTNGHSWSDIPQKTLDELSRLKNAGSTIDGVAFAPNGGWVILYDQDGFTFDDLPTTAAEAIEKLNKERRAIRGIAFTPRGGWVILCDETNGFQTSAVSQEVLDKLEELKQAGASIDVVTFTPSGGWVIISQPSSRRKRHLR